MAIIHRETDGIRRHMMSNGRFDLYVFMNLWGTVEGKYSFPVFLA